MIAVTRASRAIPAAAIVLWLHVSAAMSAEDEIPALAECPHPLSVVTNAVRDGFRTGRVNDPAWVISNVATPAYSFARELGDITGQKELRRTPLTGITTSDQTISEPMDAETGRILLLAKRVPTTASRCVIMCDGNLVLNQASDCLIVATGSVFIHRGYRNIIFGGHYVTVERDNLPLPTLVPNGDTSVFCAGSLITLHLSYGSICCSGHFVDFSQSVYDVGSQPEVLLLVAPGARPRKWSVPAVPDVQQLLLPDKIEILRKGQLFDLGSGPSLTLRFANRTFQVAPGDKLPAEIEETFPALRGWTLVAAGPTRLLFRKNGMLASLTNHAHYAKLARFYAK
jgi:hypothetical protein